MRNLNPREKYLLRFLRGAEVIDLPLAHELLAPHARALGQAKRGFAKNPRSSYVYVMLRRLVKERVLRRHEYVQAYLLGRKAEHYFPDDRRIRTLTRRSPGGGQVMHDLLTTHFLVVMDLVQQKSDWFEYQVLLNGEEPLLKHRGKRIKLDKLVQLANRLNGKLFWYFIESDRATAALQSDLPKKRTIRKKVERFYAYSREVGFRKHFGFPGGRLLFLVPEAKSKRADSIRNVVASSNVIHPQSDLFRYTAAFRWHLKDSEAIAKWLTEE